MPTDVGGFHVENVESVIQDRTRSFRATSCQIELLAKSPHVCTMMAIQSDLDRPHIQPQSNIQSYDIV